MDKSSSIASEGESDQLFGKMMSFWLIQKNCPHQKNIVRGKKPGKMTIPHTPQEII
jgi:hypothetical protein